MGGFLGSYFADGDEAQLHKDIELHDKKEPAETVNFKELEGDAAGNDKWGALDQSLPSLDVVLSCDPADARHDFRFSALINFLHVV